MATDILTQDIATAHEQSQPGVGFQDLHDKLSLLDAMLQNTHGESTGGFNYMDEEQRAWYLQHCQDLVGECRRMSHQLQHQDMAQFHAMMTLKRAAAPAHA